MQIKVNGEWREFSAPMTVAQLAEALALNTKQVAVEKNRAIVPRATYGDATLADGDEVEIVRFIGGG
ncbi:MAG: sulfur carrier protein ThiS [Rickettsiales bacterium]|nr:sulfur carrier protein ThiS [Rickettsiales bacterium]